MILWFCFLPALRPLGGCKPNTGAGSALRNLQGQTLPIDPSMVSPNLPFFSRREQCRDQFRDPISPVEGSPGAWGMFVFTFLVNHHSLRVEFPYTHLHCPWYLSLREIKMGWRCWRTAWSLRRDSFEHRREAGWGTGWRILGETWARGNMAGSAELQCLTWESSRLTKNPL